MKRRLEIDWKRDTSGDFSASLKQYERYLRSIGFRDSTIISYSGHICRYLKFAGTDRPSIESAMQFRQALDDKRLARSTLNNYSFAISKYHEMLGEDVSFPFLKRNDELPYYFGEEEVRKIFDVCTNLKHYAMLQTLFYGCLRASELCNLDDQDIDLKTLTMQVRAGKGGRDGVAYLSNECARALRCYLEVRPQLEIDNRIP
ncbi:MAG TPA: tyrosine-type recombinase/integrase, partial [Methanothrix sp.]|nr:tyrosine-type recombinase/integrase [Methanothrix sp.]